MALSQVKGYQTSDGELHIEEEAAAKHEARITFKRWIEESIRGPRTTTVAGAAAEAILEQADEAVKLLLDYTRAKKK